MKPLPMLATKSAPFDSDDYLFEVKWDGVRALAAVEPDSWSLWGRHGVDYTTRYPELNVLRRLPRGTVVDGELVVLDQGRADLPTLLRRHLRRRPLSGGCPTAPLCYVLFDLLCLRGRALLKEPLVRRRELLRELLDQVNVPLLAYSCENEKWLQQFKREREGMSKEELERELLEFVKSPWVQEILEASRARIYVTFRQAVGSRPEKEHQEPKVEDLGCWRMADGGEESDACFGPMAAHSARTLKPEFSFHLFDQLRVGLSDRVTTSSGWVAQNLHLHCSGNHRSIKE